MVTEKLILKVQKNKGNGQKFVNIPKNSKIKEEEYVSVRKILDNDSD